MVKSSKSAAVVIATHNRHKLKEIKKILGRLPFQVLGLDAFPPAYNVRETGKTLVANALIKARAAHKRTGRICLSDDTGLFVKALRGAPGVYSARYAGPHCSFEDNNRKLLGALKGKSGAQRAAIFCCVVAVALPGRGEKIVDGRVAGRITETLEGAQGFGYDPVFKPAGQKRTYAQMSLANKNRASHRARAFRAAAKYLARLYRQNPVLFMTGRIPRSK